MKPLLKREVNNETFFTSLKSSDSSADSTDIDVFLKQCINTVISPSDK